MPKEELNKLRGIRRNALLHPHNLTTNKINYMYVGNGILLTVVEMHKKRIFLQLLILSKHIRVHTLLWAHHELVLRHLVSKQTLLV